MSTFFRKLIPMNLSERKGIIKAGVSGKGECMKPFRLVLNVCECHNFLGENGLVSATVYHDYFFFFMEKIK